MAAMIPGRDEMYWSKRYKEREERYERACDISELKVTTNKKETTMNLSISKERVVATAKENPCAAKVLESLFPEAFEDNTVFCTIGSIFTRKSYNHVYAVFKWKEEVRILNITANGMWKEERNLKVSELKDSEAKTLTVTEFKKLTGKSDLTEFSFDVVVNPIETIKMEEKDHE